MQEMYMQLCRYDVYASYCVIIILVIDEIKELGTRMDESMTFIYNPQSNKPLSEGLSHYMEMCNWIG